MKASSTGYKLALYILLPTSILLNLLLVVPLMYSLHSCVRTGNSQTLVSYQTLHQTQSPTPASDHHHQLAPNQHAEKLHQHQQKPNTTLLPASSSPVSTQQAEQAQTTTNSGSIPEPQQAQQTPAPLTLSPIVTASSPAVSPASPTLPPNLSPESTKSTDNSAPAADNGAAATEVPAVQAEPYDAWQFIAGSRKPSGSPVDGFLVPPSGRDSIGRMLEAMGGYHIGVELGVQYGNYAITILNTWPSCTKYYLVDLWRQQPNYEDFANFNDTIQETIFDYCKKNLLKFENKTVFIRNYTTAAVPFVDGLVDFVYVDARHDYCGVKEDLEAWWPKLRQGGIMAGHDYVSAHMVRPGQEWAICMDGTTNEGAVMGAVDEFAMSNGLQISVTYDFDDWRTWIVKKV